MMIEKYFPGRLQKITDRKERFDDLNELVQARNGWITSIPGAPDVTIECLPNSTLPDDLRGLGYDVVEIGGSERILHSAIVQRFVAGLDDELVPLRDGSSRPVALTVTNAGICEVKKYAVSIV